MRAPTQTYIFFMQIRLTWARNDILVLMKSKKTAEILLRGFRFCLICLILFLTRILRPIPHTLHTFHFQIEFTGLAFFEAHKIVAPIVLDKAANIVDEQHRP